MRMLKLVKSRGVIRRHIAGNEPEFRAQHVAHGVHSLPNRIVELRCIYLELR